jgi:hypothetical protein
MQKVIDIVVRQDGSPAAFSMKEHVSARTATRPEITVFGVTVSPAALLPVPDQSPNRPDIQSAQCVETITRSFNDNYNSPLFSSTQSTNAFCVVTT